MKWIYTIIGEGRTGSESKMLYKGVGLVNAQTRTSREPKYKKFVVLGYF